MKKHQITNKNSTAVSCAKSKAFKGNSRQRQIQHVLKVYGLVLSEKKSLDAVKRCIVLRNKRIYSSISSTKVYKRKPIRTFRSKLYMNTYSPRGRGDGSTPPVKEPPPTIDFMED